jgi:CheY-like chemotaxis protein
MAISLTRGFVPKEPRPRRTALVVEDESPVAAVVEEMLRELGYDDVHHADNIEGAIASLDTARPSIVILDANLNGIMADRVARRLRDAGVPFVIATGLNPPGLPKEFRFGVPLRKPYTVDALASAINIATTARR